MVGNCIAKARRNQPSRYLSITVQTVPKKDGSAKAQSPKSTLKTWEIISQFSHRKQDRNLTGKYLVRRYIKTKQI